MRSKAKDSSEKTKILRRVKTLGTRETGEGTVEQGH